MYRLHSWPDSASLIVRLALEELALPHQVSLIDRAGGELDSPAYRAIHPLGKIPAFETPDGPMFETAAILLYLSDRHPGLAPEPQAPERAAFLKWLVFTANTLHADARMHFYPDQYAGASEAPTALRRATEARLLRHLALLDGAAAGGPGFLRADTPSVLGYYVLCLCRWIMLYPLDREGWMQLSDFPALFDLGLGLQSRPAALRVSAAEGLGADIFTRPRHANPPEGSVL